MIPEKKLKVALLFICLNPLYWPYARDVINDCNKNFLSDHRLNAKLDFFLWSDIPEADYGCTVFPTEPIQWPMPTLMRYHLFLQQEEVLKDYDYIFYLDADMRVVAPIGEEILGDGLTAAQHPMYALKQEYWLPYEPNPESMANIKIPGRLAQDQLGRPLFQPLYFAGGFQGGKAKDFIKAMKEMRKNIDKDFTKNYTARWNDESHWNRYLFDHPPVIVLSPSYIYPDSLIKEYYEPLWGCSYEPKIITLTKPFSVSKEGGEALRKMLKLPENANLPGKQFVCPKCGDMMQVPGMEIVRLVECQGKGVPHQVEMKKYA